MLTPRAALSLTLLVVTAAAGASAPIIPLPPQLAASAYILIDVGSGKTLVEQNSRQRLPPASLTKIMTSYIAAAEVEGGRLRHDEMVNISVNAWRMQGSKMFIREGTQVSVEDLLKGIVIQSGNDASVAIAEHIAGGEDAFADVMNQHAARLGMTDSSFRNATGWPDDEHYTTTRDLATLAKALILNYPAHYKLYAEKSFKFNGIDQRNRNLLLWRDKSVDGVKTGHTEAAGYCLVSSAVRDGMRLIAVVMGADSLESRAQESQKLLSYGFRYYATHTLYEADSVLRSVRVWGGESESLQIGIPEAVTITIPRGAADSLNATMDVKQVLQAPLAKGANAGKLTVRLDEEVVFEGPLVVLSDVPEAGFVGGAIDGVLLFFRQVFGGDPLEI